MKHVVLTEFLLKILRERDLSSVFPFSLQLSNRTGDLHFRLYSVSNILDKHKRQIKLGFVPLCTGTREHNRQKDGYKVTVIIYDNKRWRQVGTPCIFHSR